MDEEKKPESEAPVEPPFLFWTGVVILLMVVPATVQAWWTGGATSNSVLGLIMILNGLHYLYRGRIGRREDGASLGKGSFRKLDPISQAFVVFVGYATVPVMGLVLIKLTHGIIQGDARQRGVLAVIAYLVMMIAALLGIWLAVRFLRWYRRNFS
jgi:hypothetical protein